MNKKDTPTGSDDQEPLAPFQDCTPFELAALAVLLGKGKNWTESLRDAASLWAQAHRYIEELRKLFWGPEQEKRNALFRPVLSTGTVESYLTVQQACAQYSWGEKHLRGLVKNYLPAHAFAANWKAPIKNIRLPKTMLDDLEKLQKKKRIARARKAVKRS